MDAAQPIMESMLNDWLIELRRSADELLLFPSTFDVISNAETAFLQIAKRLCPKKLEFYKQILNLLI